MQANLYTSLVKYLVYLQFHALKGLFEISYPIWHFDGDYLVNWQIYAFLGLNVFQQTPFVSEKKNKK